MNQIIRLCTAVLILSVLITACDKNRSKSKNTVVPIAKTPSSPNQLPPPPPPVNYWNAAISASSDVSILLKELEKPINTQSFAASSSAAMKLYFPDGLSVTLYPPLRFTDGSTVTGTVLAEEILLRKKGDFIRQNRPTQTASAMLVTGGSYYLNLSQNGQEIQATYTFRLPQSSENFSLFDGVSAANNQNIWAARQDSGLQRTRDSIGSKDTFYSYCCIKQFKWINCDYFYNCGCPLTKVSAKLPAEYGNTNTQVFCIFKDINSVTSLYGNTTSKLFETGASYKAPIGKECTLVSVTRKDGKYFIGTKDVTLTLDGVYDITPTETTLAAMKTILDGL